MPHSLNQFRLLEYPHYVASHADTVVGAQMNAFSDFVLQMCDKQPRGSHCIDRHERLL